MNKRLWAAFLAVLFLALAGCASPLGEQKSQQGPVKISAPKAQEMMEGEAFTLVDVRTPEEFEEGHIPGAVLLPDGQVAEKAEQMLPEKDGVVLLYCRSGRRSALAAGRLWEMGYTKVYDFGGIIDWPYEIVTGP